MSWPAPSCSSNSSASFATIRGTMSPSFDLHNHSKYGGMRLRRYGGMRLRREQC